MPEAAVEVPVGICVETDSTIGTTVAESVVEEPARYESDVMDRESEIIAEDETEVLYRDDGTLTRDESGALD